MKKIFLLFCLLLSLITANSQTVSFGNNYVVDSKTHIPIQINNMGSSMSSISLSLFYDTELFEYCNYVDISNISSSGPLLVNNTNNNVKIAWMSLDSYYVNGTFIELVFENKKIDCSNLAWENDGISCNISLATSGPPGEPFSIDYIDKYVCVDPYLVNIIGDLRYHNDYAGIDGCNIDLYSNVPIQYISSHSTGNGGIFNINDITCGEYILGGSVPKPHGGVNALDALLTMKYYVGSHNFDEVQKLAADANNDGTINATDALVIAKHFTGLLPFTDPWIVQWKPISAYSNDDYHIVDAICRGDVDNSYLQPIVGNKTLDSNMNVTFGNPIDSLNSVYIPVLFKNIPLIGSISLKFDYTGSAFEYDTTFVQLVGGLSSTNCINNNVMLAWFGSGSTSVDTAFLMKFNKLGIGCDDFIWSSVPFACEITDYNGVAYNVTFENSNICNGTWMNNKESIDENIKIYSINNQVVIENTNYKQVQIYDILGRLITTDNLTDGNNIFNLNKKGIYIVKLLKDHKIINKKIVI